MNKEINNFINHTDQSVNIVMNIPEAITEVIAALLQERDRMGAIENNMANEEIAKSIQNHELDAIEFSPKMADNIINEMQANGIEPVLGGQYNNKHFLYLSPYNRCEVMKIMEKYEGKFAMEQSSLNTDNLSKLERMKIDCVNEKEARGIQYEAAKQGISTDIVKNNKDKTCEIRYHIDDKAAMKSIFKENAKIFVSIKELSKLDANFKTIKFSDETSAYMAVKRAEQNGIRVSCHEKGFNNNEKYLVNFESKNERIMNRIANDVCIDLAGKSGEAIKKQVEYEMNTQVATLDKVLNKTLENGSVILDDNGHTLIVNENTYEYQQNNKNNPEYILKQDAEKLASVIHDKFDRVIIMSKDEFNAYSQLNNEEQHKYFIHKEKEQGRPEVSDTEKMLIAQKEREREIYNAKINEAHPEKEVEMTDDYNPEQSYIEYVNITEVNENEIEEEREEIQEDIINSSKEIGPASESESTEYINEEYELFENDMDISMNTDNSISHEEINLEN